jgi:uncharacterized protein (DUF1330 family)
MTAHVIGNITIKDAGLWTEYRGKVPATLPAWGGELVLRGHRIAVFSGQSPHTDTVVLRFPDARAALGWFQSPAYQALIALRDQAADVVLVAYESEP